MNPQSLVSPKRPSDHQLIPSEELGYSKIYLDFLAGEEPARRFYNDVDLETAARALDQVLFDRARLVDLLLEQHRLYNGSVSAKENIEKLRDPRAVCVFSGQQAGFLGGPLLTLTKALAVGKAARECAAHLDRPVVPIFWIAGDDHDFEEANHTWLLDRGGEAQRVAYKSAPEIEVPVAEIKLNDETELNRALTLVQEILGETDFTGELYQLLRSCYQPGVTFSVAFGRLMANLTADYGVVMFCPGDPAVKRHAVPFFKRLVQMQDEIHNRLDSRNTEITDAGYHIQVEKSEDSAHLFCNLDGRKPVKRVNGSFVIGERKFTNDELLSLIDEKPELFSPDVMTRPVFQSWLFPTVSQKGGPAEIAYLAQLNPLFELFDLPVPIHRARPSFTVVEKRFFKHLSEYGIRFEELTGDIEQVINRVLAKSYPEDLEAEFNQLRNAIKSEFRKFSDAVLEFDKQLKKVAEQTHGKIDYTVKGFESKVFAAHKRHSQDTRERIYRLYNSLYPNRALQERSINVSYFLARYGRKFIDFLYHEIECDQKAHLLISMSEFQTT